MKSGVAQNLIYRYHICSTAPKCLPHEQEDDDAGPVYDLDQDRSGFEGFYLTTLGHWVSEVYTHASSTNVCCLCTTSNALKALSFGLLKSSSCWIVAHM